MGTKILVTDDDSSQRLMLNFLLRDQGYDVILAENGEKALEILSQEVGIHIIITDLSMPRMDGHSLIREIRDRELTYTYIIVLTSASESSSRIKALKEGADDYLLKPFSPQELMLRLKGAKRLLQLMSHQNLTFAMAKLAEFRSRETGFHLERVRLYSGLLGKTYALTLPSNGLSLSDAGEIALLSPLHDIGKVAIPDKILNKPGKLTAQELEVMKTHTRIGGNVIYEIYQRLPIPYLLIAYEIVMHHHERWDGKGYPDGLKEEEIPLSARIVSLADFYDAVTTKRIYKNAISPDEAVKMIVKGKGKHFDPELVECFLKVKKEFAKICVKEWVNGIEDRWKSEAWVSG